MHDHAGEEAEERGGRDVTGRRARLHRRRVHRLRRVLRDIDDLRIGRLDHDDLLAVGLLGRDRLLLGRLEVADRLRLGAKPLHGRKHRRLVGVEHRAKLLRPVEIRAHHVDDGRELHERLHARPETGLDGLVLQRGALEVLVLEQPVAAVHHFLRVRGRGQDLAEQRVGVEGDGRQQLIECRRRELGRRGRRGRGERRGGRRCRQGRLDQQRGRCQGEEPSAHTHLVRSRRNHRRVFCWPALCPATVRLFNDAHARVASPARTSGPGG